MRTELGHIADYWLLWIRRLGGGGLFAFCFSLSCLFDLFLTVWVNEKQQQQKKGLSAKVSLAHLGALSRRMRNLPGVQRLLTVIAFHVLLLSCWGRTCASTSVSLCGIRAVEGCLHPQPVCSLLITSRGSYTLGGHLTSHALWVPQCRQVTVPKKMRYSVFPWWKETHNTGILWRDPAAIKSPVYTRERILILQEARLGNEASRSLQFEGCALF